MKYLRKGGGVPKEILFAPPRLDFDNETFKNFKVENDRLIIDRSGLNWIFIVLGGLLSLVSVSYYSDVGFSPYSLGNSWYLILVKLTMDIICLSILYMFLQGFLGYKKILIFDRAKGTVTYPEDGWFRSKTIPFNDACFILPMGNRLDLNARSLELVRSIGISSVGISNYKYPRELFSLLVWYMDKNRPLPPGDKFDPFRQQDYQRRQAEGFPMPLYPATIRVPDIDGKEPSYCKKPIKENQRVNLSRKERKNKKN